MNSLLRYLAITALLSCAFLGAAASVRAQETPASATPAPAAPAPATPAPVASPTLMDMQYDGRTHIMAAPYIWAPQVGGNFEFTIPSLPRRPGGISQFSAAVGPSQYLPKINSAVMFAFDARKGDFDVFGDFIYLNATLSGSTSTTLTGPFGKLHVPLSISTNARLRQSIWEAAAGFTVARGHNADLSLFAGMREFPLRFSFDYNATIGQRRPFTRSGSIITADIAQDVIFGLRGKAFFGDSHLFVPYYADYGTAIGQLSNQTWQAYSGAGYAFNHGQTLVALYRSMNFFGFSPISHVQKLSLYGPLLGYTFYL